ncbi:MAG: hypothetical protein U1F10_09600 [Burkholderiales bacterium]
MMRRGLVVAAALLCAACASDPLPSPDRAPRLPDELADARDLRGPFRAAFCAREANCDDALWRFAGEAPVPPPARADPARFHLLFVPGFLASCFPDIHTFGDVMQAAREQGYAVDYLEAAGRAGVAANARTLALAVAALPDDGRRLVFVAHSKGAVDVLQMLVDQPAIARRTTALVAVAGALQGSPLADRLDGLYGATFGAFPFRSCAKDDGTPVQDLQREARRRWWTEHGNRIGVPVYSLVSVPEATRLAPTLYPFFMTLTNYSRYNDGMLLAAGQVAPGGALLGVVDADHLSIGIPRPETFPQSLWFSPVPFPRTAAILAAIDVVAADAR